MFYTLLWRAKVHLDFTEAHCQSTSFMVSFSAESLAHLLMSEFLRSVHLKMPQISLFCKVPENCTGCLSKGRKSEKLALILVTLGQVHLEQIDLWERKGDFDIKTIIFCLCFFTSFFLLYLYGSGKEIIIGTWRYPCSFRIFYSI